MNARGCTLHGVPGSWQDLIVWWVLTARYHVDGKEGLGLMPAKMQKVWVRNGCEIFRRGGKDSVSARLRDAGNDHAAQPRMESRTSDAQGGDGVLKRKEELQDPMAVYSRRGGDSKGVGEREGDGDGEDDWGADRHDVNGGLSVEGAGRGAIPGGQVGDSE